MKSKSLEEFFQLVSSDAPAPGGGAVVAYVASLALALTSMAARISKKRKHFLTFDQEIQESVSKACESLTAIGSALQEEIQKDVDGFTMYLQATKLPRDTEEQIVLRDKQLEEAANKNIMLPYHVLKLLMEAFDHYELLAPYIVASIQSDFVIGIMYLETSMEASIIHLKINLPYVKDETILKEVRQIIQDTKMLISTRIKNLKQSVLQSFH